MPQVTQVHLYDLSRIGKSRKTVNLWLLGTGGMGKGNECLIGYKVCFGSNENVLELDCSCDCTNINILKTTKLYSFLKGKFYGT